MTDDQINERLGFLEDFYLSRGKHNDADLISETRRLISSLLKERGELREAIKPFAEGQTTVQYGKVAPWVTYEELHRARSALQGNGDDK